MFFNKSVSFKISKMAKFLLIMCQSVQQLSAFFSWSFIILFFPEHLWLAVKILTKMMFYVIRRIKFFSEEIFERKKQIVVRRSNVRRVERVGGKTSLLNAKSLLLTAKGTCSLLFHDGWQSLVWLLIRNVSWPLLFLNRRNESSIFKSWWFGSLEVALSR